MMGKKAFDVILAFIRSGFFLFVFFVIGYLVVRERERERERETIDCYNRRSRWAREKTQCCDETTITTTQAKQDTKILSRILSQPPTHQEKYVQCTTSSQSPFHKFNHHEDFEVIHFVQLMRTEEKTMLFYRKGSELHFVVNNRDKNAWNLISAIPAWELK